MTLLGLDFSISTARAVLVDERGAEIALAADHDFEREHYRRFGCLEAEVAAPGIGRRLVWRIRSGDESRALGIACGSMANIGASLVAILALGECAAAVGAGRAAQLAAIR